MNLSHELKLTVIIPIGFRAAWSFVHEVIIRKQTGGIVDNEPLRVSSHLIIMSPGDKVELPLKTLYLELPGVLSMRLLFVNKPVEVSTTSH